MTSPPDAAGDEHVAVHDEHVAGDTTADGDPAVGHEHVVIDGAVDDHGSVDGDDRTVHHLARFDDDVAADADAPVAAGGPVARSAGGCRECDDGDHRQGECDENSASHASPSQSDTLSLARGPTGRNAVECRHVAGQ